MARASAGLGRPAVGIGQLFHDTRRHEARNGGFAVLHRAHRGVLLRVVAARFADASLVESKSKGRLFFTLAHEAGHWMLHRTHISRSAAGEAAHFCRVQDAKKPVEWQADYFASCLLMPEKFVCGAFQQAFGCERLSLHNVQAAYCGPLCFDPCIGTWPRIAATVMEAGGFTNVSKQAMIIRLQDLDLVRNATGTPILWRRSVAAD